MKNLNEISQKKQLAVLIGVLAVAGIAASAVYYFTSDQPQQQTQQASEDPNMTGLINSDFTSQVSKSAIAQQQEKTAQLEDALTKIQNQLLNNDKKDAVINKLSQELDDLKNQMSSGGSNTQSTNTPKTAWSVTENGTTTTGQANSSGQPLNFPQGQGANSYSQTPVKPHIGGMKHTAFEWGSDKPKGPKLPWISSGSFINAVMVEGADANASVTGEQSSTPVVLTLLGNASLPNGKKYNLDQCRVTGEIYGDISSERGEVRTHSISCNLPDGKHIDMPFKGHVSFEGKEGIRGKPVMRNGQILMNAGGAGFLSGIGEGFQSAGTTTVGVGATSSPGAGDILKQGVGGGASKAADTLSQYYIQRAEQYHPVIDIGAGNAVTVVFQEGFRLTTIEDAEAEEAVKNGVQKTADNVSDDVNDATDNVKGNLASGNAMINPDDVIRKAKNLDLGQTIQ
ncbi:F-type conjugal transfer pilus assembly protein TraB [Rosenbergiella collisarenosi]|uniref:F-type conjugal transfer pilus assembly protein TraB n=1 Tax=Rosenbergiella collisarenosi TaxID=1544695 RepID=UPI001F4D7C58|nr:F-type conjugal transfer pilus assembly protein TraB [Rosenbergiella collisarenosi]